MPDAQAARGTPWHASVLGILRTLSCDERLANNGTVAGGKSFLERERCDPRSTGCASQKRQITLSALFGTTLTIESCGVPRPRLQVRRDASVFTAAGWTRPESFFFQLYPLETTSGDGELADASDLLGFS